MNSTKATSGFTPTVWIAAIGLILTVAVPFVAIVLQAIFPNFGSLDFTAPFTQWPITLGDVGLLHQAFNTVLLGVGVALLAAIVALPLATARALFRVPFAALWDGLLLVPFMIPPYIAVLGWIMTLQPRGYLQQLLGFNLAPALFSIGGVVFVIALNTLPVVYFALSRTIEAVGIRYADVARVFGASPARAFWRIVLPLATPGLAGSLLLVFAMAIEEYGTPAALGRRAGFDVLVTGIDLRVSDWPIDLPGAAIMSLILVALSFLAFLLQRQILARRSYVTTGGKPTANAKRSLGRYTIPVVTGFALISFLATGVPLLAILFTALSKRLSDGLAWSNFGADNFFAITDDGAGALGALGNSLLLGVATALLTGLIGAIASYAVMKTRTRGRFLLDVLTVLPNALPGIVVAVGLILAWNFPGLPITPYNTPFILLLAYCCILLPQPVRYTTAALSQISDNLEAAARVFGASGATAFAALSCR